MAAAPSTPSPLSDTDQARLGEALVLAGAAVGLTEPNPRVGCIVTAPDGRILGRGHTQVAGGAHAEVMALRDAAARGEDVRGATVYVTLEPCAHHGRTPPCCDALVAAGVGRVVSAIGDPNPLVAGRGTARLRAAGIVVDAIDTGPIHDDAREINIGFFSRMERGRPWVRLKAALSVDGRTSLLNGASQWITGTAARTDGHRWRRRAGAVLTGAGTVAADDPRMDVRLVETARQPLRVVLDSTLRTRPDARILEAPGTVLFYAARVDDARRRSLEQRAAEVVVLPAADGRVDIAAVLVDLGRRGINELHVEAGARLNGAFSRGGWVDEWLLYVAPVMLGPGHGIADGTPLTRLADADRLHWHSVERVGDDLRLLVRKRH